MATGEFHERKVIFETAVQAGKHVLEHPDFDFSSHPYARGFVESLDNATLGIVDVTNGMIHAKECMRANGVAIVPLTQSDIKRIKPNIIFTYSDEFLLEADMCPTGLDFSHLKDQQAECRIDNGLVVPMIFLHPDLGLRTPLQLGSTVVHEMDHGYWDRHPAEVWPHGNIETLQGDVSMEVSAYTLEEKVFAANAPQLYAEAVRTVRAKYGSIDYATQEVKLKKGANHLARNMRSVAFLNALFRHYGVKPGDFPTPELIEAVKTQRILSSDKEDISNVHTVESPIDTPSIDGALSDVL